MRTKGGKRLSFKKARERSGLSQNQIATALNIDQSAVSLWESGKTHPRAKLLPTLAKLLGCSIDDLLSEDGKPPGDVPTS
ncbi:MAG: helix-turn-helix transcriptional regulator [Bacteroides sp.]|nr:helix-turn-helix transcriptional regulator [Bacteroides sp.]